MLVMGEGHRTEPWLVLLFTPAQDRKTWEIHWVCNTSEIKTKMEHGNNLMDENQKVLLGQLAAMQAQSWAEILCCGVHGMFTSVF